MRKHGLIPLLIFPAFLIFLGLLIFTVLLTTPASAQIEDATQAFDRGTAALSSGSYRDAVNAFDEAERTGMTSAALYYNRAVAHYRLDETGEAVRYLHRARALDPDDPRMDHGLGVISARLRDQYSQLPAPIWKRIQRTAVSVLSIDAMILTGLALYVIAMALVIVRIRRGPDGDWMRRLRWICGAASLVFLAGGFSSAAWPPWPDQAVVLSEELSLHEQPDASSLENAILHEGLVVSEITSALEWKLVQLPNGVRGWVEADGLGEI